MALGGCAASGGGNGKDDLKRELPPKPAYLAPVKLPEPSARQPLLVVAAENRSAAIQANRRLSDGAAFYDCVRAQYRAGKPMSCQAAK